MYELLNLLGDTNSPSQDRRRKQTDRSVVDRIRLQALRADGVMALAEHIMAGVRDMDDTRRLLSRGDPGMNTVLADIEARALLQISKIQAQTFSPWDL